MRSQVKTKERVRQHGEVFTAEREVMAMMDLVKEDASNIDSTFFEPACGDGNFLAEILSRKMRSVFKVALSNDADCEYWATRAFSTIYGVDIMLDNVEEARNRLFDSFFALFINRYKHQPTSICQDSVRFILSQNIQCGDTLACKQSDGNPLTITKWAFDDGGGLTVSLFDYRDIPTDKREFIGSNRYSSNGIPCLYLANSILTCWEELNRPSLDSFWVSRFWPVKEIRVLNLSVTGYEIINAQQYIRTVSENKDAYDQVVVDFFSTWVLQSACSVAVRSKANRLFREEYLIPQLLMQNVKRFDANAIMYFSTKTPLLIGDKEIATNFQTSASWIAKAIALPVFETTGDRFSAQINEDFAVSLPINIGLYQNHLMPQEPPFISDENWSRISAPAYITLAPAIYGKTVFYRCETELFQSCYKLSEKEGSDKT